MNKIEVVNDNISDLKLNDDVSFLYQEKESLFGINRIIINILNNTNLNLQIDSLENTKLQIQININKNKKLNLNILLKGEEAKIQYEYNLNEKSSCSVYKFNNIKILKEMNITNLDGLSSSFNINLKTICTENEKYDFMIYHNKDNTNSDIKNNGVNIKQGNLFYQVSTFIPKHVKNATANQYNKIINLTNNKCEIKPNLYIDSYDVNANHCALISKFDDEELFYLQSRGIDEHTATNMLISGFLLGDIKSKILKENIGQIVDKYWG